MISSNNNKVPVIVRTSETEIQMITTDTTELAELFQKLSENEDKYKYVKLSKNVFS